MVLGDESYAAMRAGAALRAAAASAAASGEDGGRLLGLWVGGGWLQGPGLDSAAPGADPVDCGVRWRRGTVVSAGWAGLGWVGFL